MFLIKKDTKTMAHLYINVPLCKIVLITYLLQRSIAAPIESALPAYTPSQ